MLPRSGWVAWLPDGKVLAYSAYAPGTRHRVDFLRDRVTEMQYLNPRGETVLGETQPTLWSQGRVVMRLDPATGDAWVEGQEHKYAPPRPKPLDKLDFRFSESTLGWRGQRDLGPLRIENGVMTARIVGDDPGLAVPPVDLAPDSVKTIVVRMRITCGKFGQLYFQAEGSKANAEGMCVHFDIIPDGQLRDVRINVGSHPLWRGRRITRLRLDPEHGAHPGTVEIESIRGE